MSIRLKLILPAAVIVLTTALLAWPGARRDGASVWLLGAAAFALLLQAAAHERWVMSALRAIATVLRDGPAVRVHGPEWHEVLARIEQLREQSCREHAGATGRVRP